MLQSRKGDVPKGIVRLLPAFDEYLLGWKDRDLAALPEHRAKINRGGGWLHPVVFVDGRLVATWKFKGALGSAVAIDPFTQLTPAVMRGVAAEAKELAAFTGVPVGLDS